MRPTDHAATPYLDVGAIHAEGVTWDAKRRRLLFVDILGEKLHDHDPTSGATTSTDIGCHVGAVAPRAGGGFVLAVREGFAFLDGDGLRVIAAPFADDPTVRMNDGNVDPGGRYFAGSMAYDTRPGAGVLCRLGVDGRAEVVLRDVTISNGIDWSDDGRRCFYIDTRTRRIDVFDFDIDAGDLRNRRSWVEIDPAVGHPDGMTIDADGGVWVALWGGGAVHRYGPGGELTHRIEVPGANQVSSCCFGGDDLTDLYISTSTEGFTATDRAELPHAGEIFVARPGLTGRAATPFAG